MLCLWYSELEVLCRHFWHTSLSGETGNMPSGVAGYGLTEALTKRGKGAVKPKTRFSLAQGDEIQNFNIFQHAGESKLKIRCRPVSEKFHGTTTAAEWAICTSQVSSSLYVLLVLKQLNRGIGTMLMVAVLQQLQARRSQNVSLIGVWKFGKVWELQNSTWSFKLCRIQILGTFSRAA